MKICVSMLRFSDRFPENMANMKTRKGKISKVSYSDILGEPKMAQPLYVHNITGQ